MRTTTIDPSVGRSINLHRSNGVREVLMLLHKRENGCAVTHMRLSAGAVLGMHPAAWAKRPVSRGSATFWTSGEVHESGTESGMDVLVIESADSHEVSAFGQLLRGRKEGR
jgi:hypothetical protein